MTAWAPAFQPANTLHGGSGMDLIRETIHGIIAYAAPAPMPETGFVVGDADLAEAGDAAPPPTITRRRSWPGRRRKRWSPGARKR